MTELMNGDLGLWVLFATGFLSATLLPGGSEANLIAALNMGDNPVWQIVAVVTIGNTLGGLTNYWLGLLLPDKTAENKQSNKALLWLKKYGYWSLLLSWMPLIGDPLCLAAGWLRMRFWWCVAAIFIGKMIRYVALAAIVLGLFSGLSV
ncbi:membrane protein [Photobacterium iliopiscarium]|jgi:membrane protein YqaA with SNARE-associated domain|uniref:DedA family protein n=1 Tax=Photobacterium iliopiscarium TaxID=56192 RepID=A0A0D8PM01_9GAMM|nr:YqaA family protein [Photobacterium iliopiscarium]KJG19623.1 membrane protein [Photobacterium iliopiscarium]MCD9468800.1 DedA family protein [Photobacterium iliopiscarium]MCD9488917.1 DedA family protein [Photobacterium iliopiscarium]MCF2245626.1 DedA family protein [Photobacterium iliopiscarium]PSV88852.1 DedA family protein [Photobacterium iliopiscarium]